MKLSRNVRNSLLGAVVSVSALISATTTASAGTYDGANVIDLAEKKGEFSVFLKAVETAGLEDVLRNSKDITLFLPTDTAFESLPEGTLDELLSPDGEDDLKKILSYHVIEEELTANDIAKEQEPAETLAGQTVAFKVEGSETLINDASVTTADLAAENGVVHIIDKVLLPKDS